MAVCWKSPSKIMRKATSISLSVRLTLPSPGHAFTESPSKLTFLCSLYPSAQCDNTNRQKTLHSCRSHQLSNIQAPAPQVNVKWLSNPLLAEIFITFRNFFYAPRLETHYRNEKPTLKSIKALSNKPKHYLHKTFGTTKIINLLTIHPDPD